MGIYNKILQLKNVLKSAVMEPSPTIEQAVTNTPDSTLLQTHRVISALDSSPLRNSMSKLELFCNIPEVFFPINFIARRIAGAHYEIKKKDGTIVWCSGRSEKSQIANNILNKPNCLQTFEEFVYCHFVYRLAEGNSFIRGAMSSEIEVTDLWKWISNLWPIPGSKVTSVLKTTQVPLYGICDIGDIIERYDIESNNNTPIRVPRNQMWHDRDSIPHYDVFDKFGFSCSRLDSVMPAIETIQAVYKARNIVFKKAGAIGIISNTAKDDAGHVAMDPKEKREIQDHYYKTHGLEENKSPVLITDADLKFLRTCLSIQDLQPFDETLLDAITIAGAYEIPDVLVPRKDHSTFSNQATAEKGVYSNVIIPMARKFCEALTNFLGLQNAGYSISCRFDHVDCLQTGLKEAEEVKKLVNERCYDQFCKGLISLNKWRAQIDEEALEDDVFDKTKFEMTTEELQYINSIINNQQPQQEKKDEEENSKLEDKGAGR